MSEYHFSKKNEEKTVPEYHFLLENLKSNIIKEKRNRKWTVKVLAEKAGMSEDTLNKFLTSKGKDCNFSTVAKLANALNVSIDELMDGGTVSAALKESANICRNLPPNALCLIKWHIRYIDNLHRQNLQFEHGISVMELECNHHGNLKMSYTYEQIDIGHLHEEYKHKVFLGVKIPCECYVPLYVPGDILLIANDRLPSFNEKCLVNIGNTFFIAKRKVENGIVKYFSILDSKTAFVNPEKFELVGYIAGFLTHDGTWGVR